MIQKLLTTSLFLSISFLTNAQTCKEAVISINGLKHDTTVSLQLLRAADSLMFQDPDCNTLLRVYSFEVLCRAQVFKEEGNKLSKQVKSCLVTSKFGDRIFFRNIRTKDRKNPKMIRFVSDQSITVGTTSDRN